MNTLRALATAHIDAAVHDIPLIAGDGIPLGLTRFQRGDGGDRTLLLVHGLTSSAALFTAQERGSLVQSLLDSGWSDIWVLDWRGSCRLPYNTGNRDFTVDDVAVYDIPAAIRTLRTHTGDRPLAIVAHCVGALGVALSMAAGLTGPIAAVVANSVFLTPNLSERSRLKITTVPPLLKRLLPEGHLPNTLSSVGLLSRRAPLFALAALGQSCKDPTCQMLSFSWGSGDSAMFEHRNLDDRMHARLAELFGPPPVSFYPHLGKMALARTVGRYNAADARYDALPQSAYDSLDQWDTPLLLMTGSENKVWTDSMALGHAYLQRHHPQIHADLLEIPGYGHMDVFLGRAAELDVFPRIVQWLDARLPTSLGSAPRPRPPSVRQTVHAGPLHPRALWSSAGRPAANPPIQRE